MKNTGTQNKFLQKNGAPFLVTIVYFFVTLFVIRRHEIWLDEAHHWLLACRSGSLGEMFHNMRFEGHPPLWNSILFFVSRISHAVFAMQLTNVIIMSAGVFIFLRNAPFPLWARLLFVFSYFIGFEYVILSRNYGLAFTLLVAALSVYPRKEKSNTLFCILLALLALTHFYATLLACLLFLFYAYENSENLFRRINIPGILLFAAAIAVAVFFCIVPPGNFIFKVDPDALFSLHRVVKSFGGAAKSFFLFPDWTNSHWWNNSWFIVHAKKMTAVFFAGLLALLFFRFRSDKPVFIFFCLSFLLLTAALYISPFPVAYRHGGFFVLQLAAAYWLFFMRKPGHETKYSAEKYLNRSADVTVVLLLCIACAGTFASYYLEYRDSFSGGKNVAQWITRNYPGEKVSVFEHFAGPAVSAYLDHDVYYAVENRWGSFCHWNADPYFISPDTMLQRCKKMLNTLPDSSLIIASDRPIRSYAATYLLQQLDSFSHNVVEEENYWLYRMKK